MTSVLVSETGCVTREQVVMRADDPRRTELLSAGWTVLYRSFGARLSAADVDIARLAHG